MTLDYDVGVSTEVTIMRRVALYLRVSTGEQTTANQRRELEAVAERAGWTITAVFEDAGVSGTKGRDRRPGFDKLMRAVTRRELDMVAAWSVDRIGRSMPDLVSFLTELHASGVDLYLHQQALDTTTPAGRAMFQLMGVFSEYERAMIVERTRAGLARARAQGKTLGRPKVHAKTEHAIREALTAGDEGMQKIARRLGCGVGTVQRLKAEMAAEAAA